MSGNEEAKNIGAANEPVLSAVSVDFCWHPDNRHGGLEWGDERQWNRKTFHAPVCHQELLCGALTAPWERMVQPDAQRGGEQDPKYHKVYNSEELLVGRIHLDCLLASAAVREDLVLLQSHSQTGGKRLRPHPSVRGVQQPWCGKHWLNVCVCGKAHFADIWPQ